MELDAEMGARPVGDGQDLATRRSRCNPKAIGHGFGRHGEGVVAPHGCRRFDAAEESGAVVEDVDRLAVGKLGSATSRGPRTKGKGLVPKTNPKHGGSSQGREEILTEPCILGVAGPGADEYVVRLHSLEIP